MSIRRFGPVTILTFDLSNAGPAELFAAYYNICTQGRINSVEWRVGQRGREWDRGGERVRQAEREREREGERKADR